MLVGASRLNAGHNSCPLFLAALSFTSLLPLKPAVGMVPSREDGAGLLPVSYQVLWVFGGWRGPCVV